MRILFQPQNVLKIAFFLKKFQEKEVCKHDRSSCKKSIKVKNVPGCLQSNSLKFCFQQIS